MTVQGRTPMSSALRERAQWVRRERSAMVSGPPGQVVADLFSKLLDVAADLEGAADALDLTDPVPLLLHCPLCRLRQIDRGEFATKAHHTHACQGCGHVWRPAIVATVGVSFLPGFKNKEEDDDGEEAKKR